MNSFLQLLGFAQKAGVITSGTDSVKEKIKKNRVELVIGATDLSDRVWKDISAICTYQNISHLRILTKLELGTAIGKSPRGLIAVSDKNFSKNLLDKINTA